jgi:hypothetical protein
VEVFESFDGIGVVVWTIDFESTPENSLVVNTQLEAGIGAGIEGIKADLAMATSGPS